MSNLYRLKQILEIKKGFNPIEVQLVEGVLDHLKSEYNLSESDNPKPFWEIYTEKRNRYRLRNSLLSFMILIIIAFFDVKKTVNAFTEYWNWIVVAAAFILFWVIIGHSIRLWFVNRFYPGNNFITIRTRKIVEAYFPIQPEPKANN